MVAKVGDGNIIPIALVILDIMQPVKLGENRAHNALGVAKFNRGKTFSGIDYPQKRAFVVIHVDNIALVILGAANVAENSVRLYSHKKHLPTDYNTERGRKSTNKEVKNE
jgi:hypothetical protein